MKLTETNWRRLLLWGVSTAFIKLEKLRDNKGLEKEEIVLLKIYVTLLQLFITSSCNDWKLQKQVIGYLRRWTLITFLKSIIFQKWKYNFRKVESWFAIPWYDKSCSTHNVVRKTKKRFRCTTTCVSYDSPIKLVTCRWNRAVRVEISIEATKLPAVGSFPARRQRATVQLFGGRPWPRHVTPSFSSRGTLLNEFEPVRLNPKLHVAKPVLPGKSLVRLYFPIVGRNLLSPQRNDRWLYLQQVARRRPCTRKAAI